MAVDGSQLGPWGMDNGAMGQWGDAQVKRVCQCGREVAGNWVAAHPHGLSRKAKGRSDPAHHHHRSPAVSQPAPTADVDVRNWTPLIRHPSMAFLATHFRQPSAFPAESRAKRRAHA